MKRLVMVVFALFMFTAATVFAAKGVFETKAGADIYVCGCGDACKCGTLGNKEGNCGCGQKLVAAKVIKVEKGKVTYKIGDKEFTAPQKGKFECGCGEGCDCGFISQKAGDCGCGKPMVKVNKKK